METQKLELMEKMEQKGMTVPQAAKAMAFDPELLALYLAKDAYPMPKRILDKLAQVVNN